MKINPFNIFKNRNQSDKVNHIWLRVSIMLIIGFLALIMICADTSSSEDGKNTGNLICQPYWITHLTRFFTALGAALLIAGASFACGGIGGFLFGIPKIQQQNSQDLKEAIIIQNDNLYQISDWITKIIVGVGLVQLKDIPRYLGRVGNSLGPVLNGGAVEKQYVASNKGSVICIVLYFLSVGFFAVYLWTRLDYVLEMKKVNQKLNAIIKDSEAATNENGQNKNKPTELPKTGEDTDSSTSSSVGEKEVKSEGSEQQNNSDTPGDDLNKPKE